MQSQFYGNIVTMSAFENRIDLAVYETCQRIKPQFWSHALALLSFCSREEEKTWRTRVKKRESHKFTHYFLLAEICFTRKRQTAKNTRFWFGILKLSLPFFPRSRFTQRRNTTVECWSFAFFVCFYGCVCASPFSFCCHRYHSRHSTHTFCSQRFQHKHTHSQTNSIYYSIYSGEYISHYCLYHWNATAIGSVYPGCYLYFAFFALRSFDGITMYIVNCEKYLLNATINNCCNELKTFVFVSAFVSFSFAGGRGRHLILSIILSCNGNVRKVEQKSA